GLPHDALPDVLRRHAARPDGIGRGRAMDSGLAARLPDAALLHGLWLLRLHDAGEVRHQALPLPAVDEDRDPALRLDLHFRPRICHDARPDIWRPPSGSRPHGPSPWGRYASRIPSAGRFRRTAPRRGSSAARDGPRPGLRPGWADARPGTVGA